MSMLTQRSTSNIDSSPKNKYAVRRTYIDPKNKSGPSWPKGPSDNPQQQHKANMYMLWSCCLISHCPAEATNSDSSMRNSYEKIYCVTL